MNVNIIITCDKPCKYNHEGECGKPNIRIDDSECKVISMDKEQKK